LKWQTHAAGKRISAQTILDFLAAGDSEQDLLEQYPKLERDDIQD
jgi:uncharacterized protein (DUF433 family)